MYVWCANLVVQFGICEPMVLRCLLERNLLEGVARQRKFLFVLGRVPKHLFVRGA